MKKTIASLALAGVLTLSAGYPAAPPAASVSEGTVVPGQAFTFAGNGFTPGEIVDITVVQSSPVAGGALGSLGGGVSMSVPMTVQPAAPASYEAVAAADGSFSAPVTLDETGTYTPASTPMPAPTTKLAPATPSLTPTRAAWPTPVLTPVFWFGHSLA